MKQRVWDFYNWYGAEIIIISAVLNDRQKWQAPLPPDITNILTQQTLRRRKTIVWMSNQDVVSLFKNSFKIWLA